jgi:hypothetical protein
MACNFCNNDIYIKTIMYTKSSILAPNTRAEELKQQLEDLTGEVYLQLPNKFCPMCGGRIPKERGGKSE